MTVLLETSRVVIRRFTLDDAPMVNARLGSDPRQMQFTGSIRTLDETRESLHRQIEWTAAQGPDEASRSGGELRLTRVVLDDRFSAIRMQVLVQSRLAT